MRFVYKSFSELNLKELYDIMVLRQEVFVVEQDCPYLDADGKDLDADHIMIYENAKLIAYTRILAAGVSYPEYTSIGRVVNSSTVRGRGIGRKLMEYSIETCLKKYPEISIKISAQVYLKTFYADLGFEDTMERYLEDNIPHMGMILRKK
jgi:ElaA protein